MTTITTTIRIDEEGCIIATATRGADRTTYDGDDYTGSTDEDMRYAARTAQDAEFRRAWTRDNDRRRD